MKKKLLTFILVLIALAGAYLCVFDKVWFIGQQVYNIIYMFCILPSCVISVAHIHGLD